MKTVLFSLVTILIANLSFSQNIYTTDGTLGTNRTVTLNGKALNFAPATATPSNGNFYINGSTGNIGLGTTSPTSRFQIDSGDLFVNSLTGKLVLGTVANFSDATVKWAIKSERSILVASSLYPSIELRSTNPAAYGWADFAIATGDYYYYSAVAKKGDVVIKAVTPGSLLFSNESSGDFKFATRANQTPGTPTLVQMIIDKDGNVGMGTTTPDAKLAVNGIIHTKEVKVDLSGWPDYVFEKSYDLPTLDEVEKHIITEKHLINIPSANEVECNGVLLGDMNKKLLEKVEELTLYVIQLNKELQVVKSQLKKD